LEDASRYLHTATNHSATKGNNMFRITTLALAAATVVGAAAFVPATASAQNSWHRSGWNDNHRSGWNDGWRHRDRHRSGVVIRLGTPYAFAPRCYTTRKWVDTRWGWQRRTVRVCR
jgi:hypothetical protein